MNFHILTLFPDMVMGGLGTSITGRAMESKTISVEAIDIRIIQRISTDMWTTPLTAAAQAWLCSRGCVRGLRGPVRAHRQEAQAYPYDAPGQGI